MCKGCGNKQHEGFHFRFPSQQGKHKFTQNLVVCLMFMTVQTRSNLGVLHQLNGSMSQVRSHCRLLLSDWIKSVVQKGSQQPESGPLEPATPEANLRDIQVEVS